MTYILLGAVLVISLLLLCTLTKTKKANLPFEKEGFSNRRSIPEVEIVPDPDPEPELPPPADYSHNGIAFAERFLQKSFLDDALRNEFSHCKGSRVTWSGRLQLAYSFRSDLIFGNRSGTRASFYLCDVTDQYGMRSTVTCVVAFEHDAAQKLRPLIGKDLTFRAKLVSLNSTTREIVLDEGTLV